MSETPALHNPSTVYSVRHLPSWLLLAFAAGSVNAGAFLACQRFVSHVSGTVSRVGIDIGQWVLMVDYALVLLCFIVGAMASVSLLEGRLRRGKAPLYPVPLFIVSLLVALVAVLGEHGVFGNFGTSVEGPADFAMLSILSFAMGLQNGAVATTTGLAVRTTHMTGPATDLGLHLGTILYTRGEARASALRGARLRGGKIVAFATGGVLMVPLTRLAGYTAFLVPAAVIVVATLVSFVPTWHRSLAPARATQS